MVEVVAPKIVSKVVSANLVTIEWTALVTGEALVQVSHGQSWSDLSQDPVVFEYPATFGPAALERLSLSCSDSVIAAGSAVATSCTLFSEDNYGNKKVLNAGDVTIDSGALTATDPTLTVGEDMFFMVGSLGAVAGDAVISVQAYDKAATATLTVTGRVQVMCTPDDAVAGTQVTCAIAIQDQDAAVFVPATGDQASTAAVFAAGNTGPVSQVEPSGPSSNFEVTFTPTVSGSASITVHHAVSSHTVSVHVRAAEVKMGMSTVACSSGTCSQGSEVTCALQTRDRFGNDAVCDSSSCSGIFAVYSTLRWYTSNPPQPQQLVQIDRPPSSGCTGIECWTFTVPCSYVGSYRMEMMYPGDTGSDGLDYIWDLNLDVVGVGLVDPARTTISCGYRYVVAGSDVTCVITTHDVDGNVANGASPSQFSLTAVGEAGTVDNVEAEAASSFLAKFSTGTSGMAQCLGFFDVCRAGIKVEFMGHSFTETVSVLSKPKTLHVCPSSTAGLTSLAPGRQVDLTFLNNAGVTALICWITYDGQEEELKTLMPQRFAKITAYDAHAFSVREHSCGTGRLLLELSSVVGAATVMQAGKKAERTIVVQNCVSEAEPLPELA